MKTATVTSLLFFSAAFLTGGCGVSEVEPKQEEQKQEEVETGDIHGRWMLEQIIYDNGDTLTAPVDTLYWIELREDSVFAEQNWHYSLVGRSNCNPCFFSYYDYNEENRSINITFICTRSVCGISKEFGTSVGSSYEFFFKEQRLIKFLSIRNRKKPMRQVLLLLLFIIPLVTNAQNAKGYSFKNGFLVKLKPNITPSEFQEKSLSENNIGIKYIEYFKHLGVWHIEYEPSKTTREVALQTLKNDPQVLRANPVRKVEYRSAIPNDEDFEDQWSLANTGQTGGSEDADINLFLNR